MRIIFGFVFDLFDVKDQNKKLMFNVFYTQHKPISLTD